MQVNGAATPQARLPFVTEVMCSLVLQFGSSPQLLQTVLAAYSAAALKAASSSGCTHKPDLQRRMGIPDAAMQRVQELQTQLAQLNAACVAAGGHAPPPTSQFKAACLTAGQKPAWWESCAIACAQVGGACACCSWQAASVGDEGSCSSNSSPRSGSPAAAAAVVDHADRPGPCAWLCMRWHWFGVAAQVQLAAPPCGEQQAQLCQALQQAAVRRTQRLGGVAARQCGAGTKHVLQAACVALVQPAFPSVAALLTTERAQPTACSPAAPAPQLAQELARTLSSQPQLLLEVQPAALAVVAWLHPPVFQVSGESHTVTAPGPGACGPCPMPSVGAWALMWRVTRRAWHATASWACATVVSRACDCALQGLMAGLNAWLGAGNGLAARQLLQLRALLQCMEALGLQPAAE
jgi:hypothetical protein